MNNSEAQAYAMVALRNLIKADVIKVKNTKDILRSLDMEMYYLMDRFSEDEVIEIAEKTMTEEGN